MLRIIEKRLNNVLFIKALVSCRLYKTLCLLGFLGFSASSIALDDGTWTYTVAGDVVTVTGCVNDCPTDLVIPDNIDGRPLVRITNAAFAESYLTSVTIPDSVTHIGEYAFSYNQLTSVIIPAGLTSIDDWVFFSNQLTSVTIPNGVTSIGDSAFASNKLKSVTIPDSVIDIGQLSFRDNRLITVTMGNSLTRIGAAAFMNNWLTSVTIPDSVTNIGWGAFAENAGTVIGMWRYFLMSGDLIISGCSVTCPTDLVIPNTLAGQAVTGIGAMAFSGNSLTSVTIPDGVTSIRSWAFYENQLTSVDIPATVTSIGPFQFEGNPLTSILFRGPRPNLDYFAFMANLNLTSIYYCDQMSGWPGEDLNVDSALITPVGIVCDNDNDGIDDNYDAFPNDPTESKDSDSDTIGDNADPDDDNDGVDDTNDAFPLNALEGIDTDGDGIGNNADTDDDGDGVLDSFDAYPLDADNNQIKMFDIDGNGQFDALTDSLLIMRYGFGFSGDELIDDAVGEGATRTSVEEIEAYLEGLTPEL